MQVMVVGDGGKVGRSCLKRAKAHLPIRASLGNDT